MGVGTGMVEREDLLPLVRRNLKFEDLSLHFCTGRNLWRSFLFCKEFWLDPSMWTTIRSNCFISTILVK